MKLPAMAENCQILPKTAGNCRKQLKKAVYYQEKWEMTINCQKMPKIAPKQLDIALKTIVIHNLVFDGDIVEGSTKN